MRHRVKAKALKRDIDHKKALIKNLSSSLVEHETVTTTLAKAKFIRPYFEKLITRAKRGSDFNNVKYMKARLSSNEIVKKILTELGPRFKNRAGGYLRITRIGSRKGDSAPMARIELTEKPTGKKPKAEEKPEAKKEEKAVKTSTKKVKKAKNE